MPLQALCRAGSQYCLATTAILKVPWSPVFPAASTSTPSFLLPSTKIPTDRRAHFAISTADSTSSHFACTCDAEASCGSLITRHVVAVGHGTPTCSSMVTPDQPQVLARRHAIEVPRMPDYRFLGSRFAGLFWIVYTYRRP